MDFSELFLAVLLEQATKTTIKILPQEFRKLFGGKAPNDIVKGFLSGYFYREDFVKSLLFSQDWSAKLGRTEFIDYDISSVYYPKDKKQVSLQFGELHKKITFPFKEEINFILYPRTKILVKGIKPYLISSDLEKLTEPNIKNFRLKKPDTFDGPNLRLAKLNKTQSGNYECRLEYASYFPQVRTNLSADFRLQSGRVSTLRLLDMGQTKQLRSLHQSMMVNTIGASAIVYFHKEGYSYFFMKLRKQLGIYENMFGTTSGEVENPEEDNNLKELTSFVSEEMKREFSYETGLNSSKVIKSIRPLALTRDLIRGGKPQFFFLIEIKDVGKKEFSLNFRKSIEGLDEFHDDLIHKFRLRNAISPEFAMNLVYAFQAMLKDKKFDIDPINLDHKLG